MDLNYNILNIITLFGAIQGFILCVFIYQKKFANKLAVHFFLLFLFSLAFYNLIYALLDMNVFQYYRPLHMFPYPYKWLIGAGFYFYIKNQFQSNDGRIFHKREWYILAPAVLYGLLRSYWFSISVSENSFRITKVIVDSEFFRIHEFFYQLFTIILLIACYNIILTNEASLAENQKSKPVLKWLKQLTMVFLGIMLLSVVLYITDLFLHDWKESIVFAYPIFVLNTTFIYWIGFKGFTNAKTFFNNFSPKEIHYDYETDHPLAEKLRIAIEEKELFTNSNITLSEFAATMEVPSKELSKYINEVHQMNFSEYLNFHRVAKVKELLASPDVEKYTIVTLANDAGFNSKSSFNDAFKKVTGMTPSSYKKKHKAV